MGTREVAILGLALIGLAGCAQLGMQCCSLGVAGGWTVVRAASDGGDVKVAPHIAVRGSLPARGNGARVSFAFADGRSRELVGRVGEMSYDEVAAPAVPKQLEVALRRAFTEKGYVLDGPRSDVSMLFRLEQVWYSCEHQRYSVVKRAIAVLAVEVRRGKENFTTSWTRSVKGVGYDGGALECTSSSPDVETFLGKALTNVVDAAVTDSAVDDALLGVPRS